MNISYTKAAILSLIVGTTYKLGEKLANKLTEVDYGKVITSVKDTIWKKEN